MAPRSLLAGSMMHTDLPVSPAFFKEHIPSAIGLLRVIVHSPSAHLPKSDFPGPLAETLPAEHDMISAYKSLFPPAHLAFVRPAAIDFLLFSSH
jgi:hypothetical protein